MSSEMLADSIVIMSNTVGASVILASGKKFFQAEPQKEYEMAMRFFKEGHGMCAAYIVLLAAGTFVAILVASEILDTWVALYALSTALSLLWSLKNGAENASVCDAIFISFCQDRLGTSTVKTQHKDAFSLGFPGRGYYPIGLISPSLQLALVLVFVGFDYSFGLFLLSVAFYLSFMVVAMTTREW